MHMKNVCRFTLIELLAVMALIAILGTIGFGVYSYSRNKAKENDTEALLKQLDAGLEGLKGNGYYPKSEGGNFSVIKVTFNTDGTVDKIDFGGEILTNIANPNTRVERLKKERFDAFVRALDLQVIRNNLDSSGAILDAWGGRIYYRSPGKFRTGSYDLISAGPDGKFGKSKAATPGDTLTEFRETGGDHVCDDIFTF